MKTYLLSTATSFLFLFTIILFVQCEDKDDPDTPGNQDPKRKDYDNGYYIGEFNDKEERHGTGTYYWNSGNVYEGQWENNSRSGQGKLTYSNGNIYEGNWKESVRDGQGTFTWTSGAKYTGSWKNDERTGYGEMIYDNKDVYKGNWLSNNRDGLGELIYTDGTTFACQWKNNSPTDEKCYLLWHLKDWYLWNNEIGKVEVNDYSSAEDMLIKLKNTKDTGSEITDLENGTSTGASFSLGTELGYGMGVRWDADGVLRVAWVYEDGPAKLYGVKRGWKVEKINSQNVQSLPTINITPNKEGENISFLFVDEKGIQKPINLTSKIFKIQSVFSQNTYQLPNKKVGYIVLRSFVEPNAEEITTHIDNLIKNGIQELVLDLRYCAGGNYVVMNKFANYIFPNAANNQPFMYQKYNQDRQDRDTTYLVQKTGNLNLDRIFVLTTSSTYNLGEYLSINLKPYLKVIQIGNKTNGTDIYGISSWIFNEKKRHTLVTAQFSNANRESVSGGLIPDYETFDGVDRDWGDENEEMLKNALYFIANGYFPTSMRSSGKVEQQKQLNTNVKEEVAPIEALEMNEKQLIAE